MVFWPQSIRARLSRGSTGWLRTREPDPEHEIDGLTFWATFVIPGIIILTAPTSPLGGYPWLALPILSLLVLHLFHRFRDHLIVRDGEIQIQWTPWWSPVAFSYELPAGSYRYWRLSEDLRWIQWGSKAIRVAVRTPGPTLAMLDEDLEGALFRDPPGPTTGNTDDLRFRPYWEHLGSIPLLDLMQFTWTNLSLASRWSFSGTPISNPDEPEHYLELLTSDHLSLRLLPFLV